MQSVTLYVKPACAQCTMTKRWFEQNNVEFTTEDILDDQNLDAVKSLGLGAAPVIFVSQGVPGDEVYWAGFQPEKLKKHVTTGTSTPKE